MKTSLMCQEPEFTPVTLGIVFESKEEFEFFRKLIGSISITEAERIAGVTSPEDLKEMLKSIYKTLRGHSL